MSVGDQHPHQRHLATLQRAWERQGDRASLVDALALCVRRGEPLPDWLARGVASAVTWWADNAQFGSGRHARYATAARDGLNAWTYACGVDEARASGRTEDSAVAIVAEWFDTKEDTVRSAYRRVRRQVRRGEGIFPSRASRAAKSYLARRPLGPGPVAVAADSDRGHLARWIELLRRYPARLGAPELHDPDNPFPEFA